MLSHANCSHLGTAALLWGILTTVAQAENKINQPVFVLEIVLSEKLFCFFFFFFFKDDWSSNRVSSLNSTPFTLMPCLLFWFFFWCDTFLSAQDVFQGFNLHKLKAVSFSGLSESRHNIKHIWQPHKVSVVSLSQAVWMKLSKLHKVTL